MKVTLRPLKHKGQNCIALEFPFSHDAKELVKKYPGSNWSMTHRLFYVKNNHRLVLSHLSEYLRKSGFIVNASSFTKKDGKQKESDFSPEKKELLNNYIRYLRGLRLSENTIKVYSSFVLDFLYFIQNKAFKELTNNDVRLFVEETVPVKKYSISTHRQMISGLKHFAFFYPECAINADELQRPSKSSYLPTVLSKEEVVDLLRVTKNLKHRTILALLYSSGIRISELIRLELKHIDIDRRQLIIKNAKGRKDRVVIMAESFIPLFQNYYMTYSPKRYFVEGPKGKIYNSSSVRSFLKRSCRDAGISKRVTPHTLRHSYATHLIENGVGLRHVQDLLGHAKPETTMIYTHVARRDLLRVRSPLDTALHQLSSSDKNQPFPSLSQNLSG
ncbi:tyrosine-type recombinase/integrase [Constantimarinum furrinae]|uniref:Integrase family protein n=1 Tax=Constantimarinum furrinae TaxID=2562285 RepID=A0A7G8PV13_9FLAO|nr:site-specific integrase [Constantimarinum furrinae]QNJ98179.1 Integrase family protein [Constantimarinum furrinae]